MSEFTFDIADYRPLSAVRAQRIQEISSVAKSPSGFVVVTSNAREREGGWAKARPAVIDIRSIRETHRSSYASGHPGSYPCRSNILRFTNFTDEVSEHVITMAPPDTVRQSDDDPDPTNFPTAA